MWSIHREKWQIGAREDWRYADMRAKYGWHWWWISFFAVYAVQQLMLVGITLPLYSVHASDRPWNGLWDTTAAIGCILGAPHLPCIAFRELGMQAQAASSHTHFHADCTPWKNLKRGFLLCVCRHRDCSSCRLAAA